MTVYFCVLLVLSLFMLLSDYFPSYRKAFLRASLLILFFISSFRANYIGADYGNYISIFNSVGLTGGTYIRERGYVFLNKVLYTISDSYLALAIGVNLLIFVPLYWFILKEIDKKYWCLCVFVFGANPYLFIQTTFNAMRQGCACGIVLIAVLWLHHYDNALKKYLGYVILVFIATQFHKSVYLLLLLPIMDMVHWSKKKWIVVATVSLGMNIIGFSNMLVKLSGLLGYAGYSNYESSLLNNRLYILFIYCVVLVFIAHYDQLTRNRIEGKQIDLYIFSLCLLIIAVTNDMIYRVYIIVALLALPGMTVIWKRISEKNMRIRVNNMNMLVRSAYIIYYISFFTFYILLLSHNGNTAYVPFQFCFGM